MLTFLRADVSTMKFIIKAFNAWQPPNSRLSKSDQLEAFCEAYINHRFSLPVQSEEKRAALRVIALMALEEFYEEVNFDGSPSLLALLGAISTAERFEVDPTLVARKCSGLFVGEISGRTLGGVGIENISEAFANGEQRFQAKRARIERGLFS